MADRIGHVWNNAENEIGKLKALKLNPITKSKRTRRKKACITLYNILTWHQRWTGDCLKMNYMNETQIHLINYVPATSLENTVSVLPAT